MAVSSTHANTPIDICSRALILIGADTITSFEDGTTEALVSVNMYEDVARTALVNSRWRFSTNQTELNLLTALPTGRYDRAYQLPSDYLMTHAATVNDNLIEYQLYGDKLFANTSPSDKVILDHTFRVDEVYWPSYFTIAVEYALATVFATAVARDTALAGLMNTQAQLTMTKARTLDSQQQTTRKLATSRFITNRRS
jgi:hypothetical protein